MKKKKESVGTFLKDRVLFDINDSSSNLNGSIQ